MRDPAPQTWSSRYTFLLAAIGAAVGLGNIWKFPFTAGASGGAAFVAVYIFALLGFALPIVIAELFIGRRGHKSPPNAVLAVAGAANRSGKWSAVGWIGIIAALVILPLYSMVAGWSLAFIPRMFSDAFIGGQIDELTAIFQTLTADPVEPVLWLTLFMFLTAFIVNFGLNRGIERAVKIMMPALFVMLLGLVIYAGIVGDFRAAATFLFRPDFSKINATVLLAAIGQAFFSVNVGLGIMMTFGAYLTPAINIPRAALTIALVDTLVALVAGLSMFPIVFQNGLDPAEGPGLIFVTLPIAFAQIPGGQWVGVFFFVLLFFAALTSTIAVLEVPVAWAEEQGKMGRKYSTFLIAGVVWLAGLLMVFSFNLLSGFHPLFMFERFASATCFDVTEFFSFNVLLPVSGLLVAFFAGWMLPKKMLRDEIRWGNRAPYRIWYFSIRYLSPVAILAVLISNVI